MSHLKKFRIYRYVDTRFQLFGMRVEQIALLIGGFFAFALIDALFWKVVALVGTIMLFSLSRRISKILESISFKSILEWHLGMRSDLGSFYPPSNKRIVVGD